MVNRTFDIIVSFVGLFFLTPAFLLISLLIKLDSPGAVFYRGFRAGRFGAPFRIFKFRTMVVDADRIGGPTTPEDDPRITRVGASLRRFKLDELPQLINVLRGEMSFVGPRPEVFSETQDYTPEERRLFEVRPGITDWASIQFRNEGEILRGSPDPHRLYQEKIRPEKVRLGLAYVERRSFAVDLRILFETLRILLVPGAEYKLPREIAEELNLDGRLQSQHR
jgi:lipopolysaccharide/colanic/teichoic acid biosynthesis glycosyltransferase